MNSYRCFILTSLFLEIKTRIGDIVPASKGWFWTCLDHGTFWLQFVSQGCLMDEDLVRLLGDWTASWHQDLGKTCAHICICLYSTPTHWQRFMHHRLAASPNVWVTTNCSDIDVSYDNDVVLHSKADILSPYIYIMSQPLQKYRFIAAH